MFDLFGVVVLSDDSFDEALLCFLVLLEEVDLDKGG